MRDAKRNSAVQRAVASPPSAQDGVNAPSRRLATTGGATHRAATVSRSATALREGFPPQVTVVRS